MNQHDFADSCSLTTTSKSQLTFTLLSSTYPSCCSPEVLISMEEVKVTVLFFAGARDLTGTESVTLSLIANTKPEQILSQISEKFKDIAKIRNSVIISVNQEYCESDQQIFLSSGDEVAVIPPISGGKLNKMDYVKLTWEKLSIQELTDLVTDPSCGAISHFVGTTRNSFEGHAVVRLEYEAYEEMAKKEMFKICEQARKKWNLKHIALYHRIGVVPVSESSVIMAVSSEHRRESLEATSFLIDELKARVPIWKKEIYDDGEGLWKKNKECNWNSKIIDDEK